MRSRRSMRDRGRRSSRRALAWYSSKLRTLIDSPGAAARREEAVAVGQRPRLETSWTCGPLASSDAADRERHDAAAVEEEQPANRPAEEQLALAVVQLRVPVHLLREREIAQHARQHVRQRVDGAAAALLPAVRRGTRPSASAPASAARTSTPVLAREAERRRRRLAVLVEGGRDRRAGQRPRRDPPDARQSAPRAR